MATISYIHLIEVRVCVCESVNADAEGIYVTRGYYNLYRSDYTGIVCQSGRSETEMFKERVRRGIRRERQRTTGKRWWATDDRPTETTVR